MKLFDVYPLFDIEIKSGKGCYTYDTEGNEYLDLYGGHAVISIGHSHPYYINKITEQAQRLTFYSNSVKNSLQQQLSDKLGKISGYEDYFGVVGYFHCGRGSSVKCFGESYYLFLPRVERGQLQSVFIGFRSRIDEE